jgi:hypothetical protein
MLVLQTKRELLLVQAVNFIQTQKCTYYKPYFSLKSIKSLIAGGLAGCIYWITALPIDVAKSRFQTAPEGKYKNLLNVYVDLLKINGFRAFYKGLTPVLIRLFVF